MHQLAMAPEATPPGIKKLARIAYNDALSIPRTMGANVLSATSFDSESHSELTTTVPIIGKLTKIPLNAGSVCASASATKT